MVGLHERGSACKEAPAYTVPVPHPGGEPTTRDDLCRCTRLAEVQLEIDRESANIIGPRLQSIIGGELADLQFDDTATHPRSLLSDCDLHRSVSTFSRLQTMVNEWKAREGAASHEKIEADKQQIETLSLEVEQAQREIEKMRQVLADATAHTSGIEQELEGIRLGEFNAVKCSLEYCKRLKVTPQEGNGKMGTCRLHCNLIASITKQNGVKAKEAKEFMAHNKIDACVLQRACDRSTCDDGSKRIRREYTRRARMMLDPRGGE
jgi:hypothetical protein